MKYKLAIFDLDGTLADSFPWFLTVVDSISDKFGFRRIAPDEVDTMRGLGAREIVSRLEVPTWKLPLIANHMRKLKTQHHTQIKLFSGVDRMLQDLKSGGLRLAMVSSDAEVNVRTMLGSANAALIDVYACGASLFGKPSKFRTVLKRTGIAANQTIAIGDEMRDADAAEQTGIAFGAVAWGYASANALASRKPAELFRTMDEIAGRLIAN